MSWAPGTLNLAVRIRWLDPPPVDDGLTGKRLGQQNQRNPSSVRQVARALGAVAAIALLRTLAHDEVACSPKQMKGTATMAPTVDHLITCDAIGAPPPKAAPQRRRKQSGKDDVMVVSGMELTPALTPYP